MTRMFSKTKIQDGADLIISSRKYTEPTEYYVEILWKYCLKLSELGTI